MGVGWREGGGNIWIMICYRNRRNQSGRETHAQRKKQERWWKRKGVRKRDEGCEVWYVPRCTVTSRELSLCRLAFLSWIF